MERLALHAGVLGHCYGGSGSFLTLRPSGMVEWSAGVEMGKIAQGALQFAGLQGHLQTCLEGWTLFFFFLAFLGLHLWHMEVPRLGEESELQLPATATATAMPDPSHVCNLHCSSQKCQILNPLSEARDRTCILWIQVGFITVEPGGNFQEALTFCSHFPLGCIRVQGLAAH